MLLIDIILIKGEVCHDLSSCPVCAHRTPMVTVSCCKCGSVDRNVVLISRTLGPQLLSPLRLGVKSKGAKTTGRFQNVNSSEAEQY